MKVYKKLFFVLLSMSIMTSCLDLDPLDQQADGNLWKSAADFKYFANNFYSWTRDFSTGVFDSPHSDHRSDLMSSNAINEYSHGSNSIPNTDKNYTDNYDHIRRTNILLQKAEGYSGGESIARYVAEARFFRAYCYFELLQLYGDVIIVTQPMDITSPELQMKRNERSEVVDFIIEDLKAAASDLPEMISTDEDGKVSKWAAYAFLSRVALYEGTWQKFRNNEIRGKELLNVAADAAKKVMDSGTFQIFKPESLGEYAYKYMFTLENVQSNPANLTKSDNKEYIFYRRHDEKLAPIGNNITEHCLKNVQYLSRKFANMYLCNDGLPIDKSINFKGYSSTNSEFENRDNRMKNTMLPNGTMYWANRDGENRIDWKGMDGEDAKNAKKCDVRSGSGYHNQKWATERLVTTRYEGYDYPIIRYAEVLLNYAEAIFEKDGDISDADLNISLNLVRCRVNPNMPKLSKTFVQTHDLNMREEIRRERTVELFNEGFRVDDLKRWKIAEIEMPQDIVGIKWTGTEFQNLWGTVGNNDKDAEGCLIMETGRIWNEKHYLYPLPADQLQLNPNLGQNPKWE